VDLVEVEVMFLHLQEELEILRQYHHPKEILVGLDCQILLVVMLEVVVVVHLVEVIVLLLVVAQVVLELLFLGFLHLMEVPAGILLEVVVVDLVHIQLALQISVRQVLVV
jgi:hypothetical protein